MKPVNDLAQRLGISPEERLRLLSNDRNLAASGIPLLTVKEVASQLFISEQTLRNRLSRAKNAPPSVKLGARRLFIESEFQQWFAEKIKEGRDT